MDYQAEDRPALTDVDSYNLDRWTASGWTLPTDEELGERFDDARRQLCKTMQRWDDFLPR